jgi:hypothetical protein
MKIVKTIHGLELRGDAKKKYTETDQAVPTSRLLDGSSDHGYWQEYVGHGTVDGIPVVAVYLLDHDQADIEDEGNYDWDTALDNGRIVVDDNKIDDVTYFNLLEQAK